jgi:hypothetical protein
MWKETTEKSRNLQIFNKEISDFVPEKVLDFHVHVFKESCLPENDAGVELPGTRIRNYTIPELKEDMRKIYPGRECSAVVFGFPDREYDDDDNNRYVSEYSDHNNTFPLRLVRPEEDPSRLEADLKNMNFFGVKPYLNYVLGKQIEDIEIHDMLPPSVMEVVNALGLIVMLHIPRSGRLSDPVNQAQIVELAEDYPRSKIVLAHVGRAYYLSNIVGQLARIAPLENLYCDIAMVNHWEVLEYLFLNFDRERILYATDLPISVCGGKSVEINNQYTYVTSKPWGLSISDEHQKIVFTSFIYEEIRAIKKAFHNCGLKEPFLEDLFFRNGHTLLQSVKEG